MQQPCRWDYEAGAIVLIVLGLRNLSEMRQLTSQDLSVRPMLDLEDVWGFYPEEEWNEVDTAAAMQEVCDKLQHLSELRELVLHSWTCREGPAAECWQTLALALPTLQHLSRLEFRELLLPGNVNSGCLLALASGLSGRTSLRSLKLTKWDIHSYRQLRGEMRAASAPLACAIGSLTGLEQLTILDLELVLSVRDCFLHLRPLGALRSLVCNHLPRTQLVGSASGSAAHTSMVFDMPQLKHIAIYCDTCRNFIEESRSDYAARCVGCPHCAWDVM